MPLKVRPEAVAAPKVGVVKEGDVAKTSAPDPVSSVTAVARFAEDGVASHVAIPDPSPEIPVDTGSPVAFVSVPEEGVPRAPPLYKTVPPAPKATLELSVPVKVRVFDTFNIFPLVTEAAA